MNFLTNQTTFLVATPEVFVEETSKVLDARTNNVPIITMELFHMIFERDDFDYADLKNAPELWLWTPSGKSEDSPSEGQAGETVQAVVGKPIKTKLHNQRDSKTNDTPQTEQLTIQIN